MEKMGHAIAGKVMKIIKTTKWGKSDQLFFKHINFIHCMKEHCLFSLDKGRLIFRHLIYANLLDLINFFVRIYTEKFSLSLSFTCNTLYY